MTVHADQLPAHIRQKLGLPARANKRPSGRAVTSGGRWSCHDCPDLPPFDKWAHVSRHSLDTGHRRFECVLG